jgi:hypothetical protein
MGDNQPTPEEGSLNRPITAPCQLLVEGRTPEIFFRKMTDDRFPGSVDVRTFGSVDDLGIRLRSLSKNVDFREKVSVVGIIRDAESGPAVDAFASVCRTVRDCGFAPPLELGKLSSNGDKRFGAFVLPDNKSEGMLETLALNYFRRTDPKVFDCVEAYAKCAGLTGDKAWVGAVLSAKMRGKDPLVGRAANIGLFNWDHIVFQPLTQFIRDLIAAASVQP